MPLITLIIACLVTGAVMERRRRFSTGVRILIMNHIYSTTIINIQEGLDFTTIIPDDLNVNLGRAMISP
jgi:hypothetical protein